MSILSKIFSTGAKGLTDSLGGIIDGLSTSDEEKSLAKSNLSKIVLESLNSLASTQRDVLIAEMSGNWIQKSWRPLMMLTFGVIIVCKWFGWTDANISDQLELELMSIIKLGISGFIGGRTIEKVVDKVTTNIDLPFLKKKDRG